MSSELIEKRIKRLRLRAIGAVAAVVTLFCLFTIPTIFLAIVGWLLFLSLVYSSVWVVVRTNVIFNEYSSLLKSTEEGIVLFETNRRHYYKSEVVTRLARFIEFHNKYADHRVFKHVIKYLDKDVDILALTEKVAAL